MIQLTLSLLGSFEFSVNGKSVENLPTDKTRALLTFLALAPQETHRREALAALLWPEHSHQAALGNLRLTLYYLRQATEKVAPGAASLLFIATRTAISFQRSMLRLDVATFQALLQATTTHNHSSLAACHECLAHLANAAALYRGEILAGFSLPDAPAFEEWLLLQRELLQVRLIHGLERWANALEARGENVEAGQVASHLLTFDPYNEATHRQVMRLFAQRGLPAHAHAHFLDYRQRLQEELNSEPDSTTTALWNEIRSRSYPRHTEHSPPLHQHHELLSPVIPLSEQEWRNIPLDAPFYGRKGEQEKLTRWLVEDSCQLVAILGLGGIGKTALAASVIRAVTSSFDQIVWCSLLNAPPLVHLLRDILDRLSSLPTLNPATSVTSEIGTLLTQLIGALRGSPLLLVFDNMESILQPDRPSQFRPGYEDYLHLLQRFVEHPHQSCLLLTSRERPLFLSHWEEASSGVRTCRLGGLGQETALTLLTERGLTGQHDAALALITRYSGNALALKLAAQTIHELFLGDIEAFLGVGTPIFDDIRHVLDQQMARLTPLEEEILVWLAIAREPVTALEVREMLAEPNAPELFIGALRTLDRRGLLERATPGVAFAEAGITLQNVVMEYLTSQIVTAICNEITAAIQGDPLPMLTTLSINRFALVQTRTKEYIRQSQVTFLLQPILDRLRAQWREFRIEEAAANLLALARTQTPRAAGYLGGNLFHLLRQMGSQLQNFDFSNLPLWEIDLREIELPGLNMSGADLAKVLLPEVFITVCSTAISPNGEMIAAGTADGDIRLWRIQDGALLRSILGPIGRIMSVAFSRDGKLLATGGDDRVIRLWDLTSGQLLQSLIAHKGVVYDVLFSPDGQLLVSGSADHTVRIWSVSSGQLLHTLHGHSAWVRNLAFNNDGTILASASFDQSIRLWNPSVGTPVATLLGQAGAVSSLAFAGQDETLYSAGYDGTIRRWNLADGSQQVMSAINHVNWSMASHGTQLAVGDEENIRLWDIQTHTLRHTLVGHQENVLSLDFSPDGRLLASGGDQMVNLWDAHSGRLYRSLHGISQGLVSVAFSPDGKLLAVGGYDQRIRLWDVVTRQLIHTLVGHKRGAIAALAFSPTGSLLASGGKDGSIRLWQIHNGAAVVKEWQIIMAHRREIGAIAFRADGERLVSGGDDGKVHLWEVASGRLLRTWQANSSLAMHVAFSPDSMMIAAGADQTIYLWNAWDGELLTILQGHSQQVRALVFSPDSRLLASTGLDGTVRIWDISSPKQGLALGVLQGHQHRVLGLAISADGATLVSAGDDHNLCVWDVASQTQRLSLKGHTHWIFGVAISPDGRYIASASVDKSVRLWDITNGETIAILTAPGPYEGMKIAGVTGLTSMQKQTLNQLGAVS